MFSTLLVNFLGIFMKFKIVVCKLYQFGRVWNLSFGKGLSVYQRSFTHPSRVTEVHLVSTFNCDRPNLLLYTYLSITKKTQTCYTVKTKIILKLYLFIKFLSYQQILLFLVRSDTTWFKHQSCIIPVGWCWDILIKTAHFSIFLRGGER